MRDANIDYRLVLSIAVAVIVSLPGVAVGLVSDDYALIRGVADSGPLGVWSTAPSDFFRPLISISIWLDYWIWGLNPIGYHVTNTVAYVGCVVFVYLIAKRFAPSGALFCAVLFAVLPVHAEALYWVSGRTDLFATAFVAGAFLAHLRGRLLLTVVLFALALLSKESAIVFPFILLAYQLIVARNRKPLLAFGALFAILVLFVVIRSSVVGGIIGGYGGEHLDFSLKNAGTNAVIQFFKPVLPSPVLGGVFGLAFLAIVVSLLLSIFAPSRIDVRKAWFCILAMVLAIAPTVTLRVPLSTTFNDRFVFLASVFAALVVALAFDARRRSHLAFGSLACIAFASNLIALSTNWIDAGRQADEFLKSAVSFDRPLAIVGVPDSYRGAYIFREGLDDAMTLHGYRGDPPLSLARLSISQTPVAIVFDGAYRSGPGGNLLAGEVEPSFALLADGALTIVNAAELGDRLLVVYDQGQLTPFEQ